MLQKIAAVITTLAETKGAPESTLYIFFDMDMGVWMKVRNQLLQSKLIQIKANFVILTPEGIKLAADLEKMIQQKAS